MSTEEEHRPALRVVRGDATEEEVAALLAVITARSEGDDDHDSARSTASTWTDRALLVRAPARSGPDAWRASGRPR